MRHLCLILSFLAVTKPSFGQQLNDSVIIYMENRVEVKIAAADYGQIPHAESLPQALKSFQELLPDISDELSPAAEIIEFSPNNSFTIYPGDPKVTYLIKEGRASNTGYRDQAVIELDSFKIFITSADISNIVDVPISFYLEQVIQMLPEASNQAKSLYYQCIDNEVQELTNKHHTNGRLDFLELNLGAGAGLVKDKWVADLSFLVVMGLVKKGVPKHRPYLSTNVLFEFNENDNIDLNMFLNLGYRPTITKDPKKSTYFGFEVGYLVVNQGELFQDTTFKLGVNWSPLKGVFVGPQLYLTDNFNKVFPGIRIGLGI